MKSNEDLKRRIDNEKSRILLQFCLTVAFAVIFGAFLCACFESSFEAVAREKALAHFYLPLVFEGMSRTLIKLSWFDIACCITLVVFSFSFLNYLVTDIIMIAYGVKFGVAIELVASLNERLGALSSVLFILFEFLILIILLVFSCRMSFVSLDMKKCALGGRLRLNKNIIFSIIFNTVTAIGTVLFINLLHCIIVN